MSSLACVEGRNRNKVEIWMKQLKGASVRWMALTASRKVLLATRLGVLGIDDEIER